RPGAQLAQVHYERAGRTDAEVQLVEDDRAPDAERIAQTHQDARAPCGEEVLVVEEARGRQGDDGAFPMPRDERPRRVAPEQDLVGPLRAQHRGLAQGARDASERSLERGEGL